MCEIRNNSPAARPRRAARTSPDEAAFPSLPTNPRPKGTPEQESVSDAGEARAAKRCDGKMGGAGLEPATSCL
jgi:hypothetical protein